MSRLSQMFWYFQSDDIPTEEEKQSIYTGITITDELKKARADYRAKYLKKNKKTN